MKVHIASGDIARVPSDALITAINSGGMCEGGIDGVIQRAAGNSFHKQAQAVMPLEHGQTIVAEGNGTNRGAFKNVVFVVDDLGGPLSQIVYLGLKAASEAGYKNVTLSTIRLGLMLGVVEKTLEEAVDEFIKGIEVADQQGHDLQSISIVVHGYDDVAALLKRRLGSN
jgi:O-acetyl-ADP-ribose deacetylase (regulator of RNase III)